MVNRSNYGVASPQEILKDISQVWPATNLHCQVSANLMIPVRGWLGLSHKASVRQKRPLPAVIDQSRV